MPIERYIHKNFLAHCPIRTVFPRTQSIKTIFMKNEFLTSLACFIGTRVAILAIWSGNLRPIFANYVYCPRLDAVSRITSKTSELFFMWAYVADVLVLAASATLVHFLIPIAFHFAILYLKIPHSQLVVNVFYVPCDHNGGIAFCISSNVQDNVWS